MNNIKGFSPLTVSKLSFTAKEPFFPSVQPDDDYVQELPPRSVGSEIKDWAPIIGAVWLIISIFKFGSITSHINQARDGLINELKNEQAVDLNANNILLNGDVQASTEEMLAAIKKINEVTGQKVTLNDMMEYLPKIKAEKIKKFSGELVIAEGVEAKKKVLVDFLVSQDVEPATAQDIADKYTDKITQLHESQTNLFDKMKPQLLLLGAIIAAWLLGAGLEKRARNKFYESA